METMTARRVLGLDATAPLDAATVEQAYAVESWARHPSRYPDEAGRRAASEWAGTLAEARRVLLAELATAPRRRRLPGGAVAGIVAGALALVLLAVGVGVGATQLAHQVSRIAQAAQGEARQGATSAPAGPSSAPVEHYATDETGFTFPAALDLYNDGRYSDQCDAKYQRGCWQAALFTKSDCSKLEVDVAFSNTSDGAPDTVRTIQREGAHHDVAVLVVFGDDAHDYGWINDVRCTDPSKLT